jgi:putative component of toxin-antitoxin plasmid stabilization module
VTIIYHGNLRDKLIKNLQGKPKLLARLISTEEKIKELSNLNLFINANPGWVAKIDGPIWEFRIPPQQSGGVIRLYFCFSGADIIILKAEVKIGVTSANQELIKQAKVIYKAEYN